MPDRVAVEEQVVFWLHELRTPEFLVELACAHPAAVQPALAARPWQTCAVAGDVM